MHHLDASRRQPHLDKLAQGPRKGPDPILSQNCRFPINICKKVSVKMDAFKMEKLTVSIRKLGAWVGGLIPLDVSRCPHEKSTSK